MREHISRFPGGAYRSEAADLLTARRTSTVQIWESASRTLVLESAKPDAERLCRGFGAGSLYRYVSPAPTDLQELRAASMGMHNAN